MTPIASTLTPHDAAQRQWDVIVLGAGPAGASAAIKAAQAGLSTLLIDKARFPRDKVCGGCLNQSSLHALDQLGLKHLPAQYGAMAVTQMTLAGHGRSATFKLPSGIAISRRSLDAAMVTHAIHSGAAFLTGIAGHVVGPGHVALPNHPAHLVAHVVVLADGLKGNALPHSDLIAQDQAHLGAGTLVPCAGAPYATNTIYMACGRPGYVGIVRVENGLLNIAGALSPDYIRARGGINAAVTGVIKTSGLPQPCLTDAKWDAVGAITRLRAKVWRPRTLIIGDASGYVEPFTGEGMAWAMRAGIALQPYLHEAKQGWTDAIGLAWQKKHAQTIKGSQHLCRALAWSLRRPWLMRTGIGAVGLFPWLATPFARHISSPQAPEGTTA